MANSPIAERLVRIETQTSSMNDAVIELLKIVKNDAGKGRGLVTEVALIYERLDQRKDDIKEHAENCPLKVNAKWHSWGIRSLYILIIGTILAWLRFGR